MSAGVRVLASLLTLSSAVIAETSWVDEYPKVAAAMNKACAAKEWTACREHLLKLEQMLDGRADIVYRLARVEAALGHRTAALERLSVFSKSGLTFADPAKEPAFADVKDDPQFAAAVARIKDAKEPVSRSKPFVNLAPSDLIAEDIAYDPKGEKFYVSGVRHSKILSIDRSGKVAEFLSEGHPDVWGILAVDIDSKRRILWAATSALAETIGHKKEDDGRSALLKYSLDNGSLIKRYDLPRDTKHALGDMTVSSSGDVYVSDGESGAVYRVDHDKDALDVLIGPGVFRSPQTPALTPDEKRLLVPDYTRGISIVDLAGGAVKLLRRPPELSLGGIDGLYLSGRTLIAIQNGTAPERVIRMTLNASLERVDSWETIEANWPGLGDPTHGVVVGKQFYFIANSGWDRMADDGTVKAGAAFEPAEVRVMPLSSR